MKYLLLCISCFLLSFQQVSAQEETAKKETLIDDMCAFGYATSLNDSIVYMTEIAQMPQVKISNKTKFLVNRASYTNQLKEYMSKIGVEHPTCAIIFDQNKKKLNKKFVTMMSKFQKKKRYFVKTISEEEFKFTAIKE